VPAILPTLLPRLWPVWSGFSSAFPTPPMPRETALPAETAPCAAIRAAWYAPQVASPCRA
jgi:hypothetical protein